MARPIRIDYPGTIYHITYLRAAIRKQVGWVGYSRVSRSRHAFQEAAETDHKVQNSLSGRSG